ncbi:hypothetical protein ACFLX9_04505 [Chloroflexota bacterium]
MGRQNSLLFLTGQSRGFAFVAMADMTTARRAVSELDGQEFMGRPLRLSWSYR